MGAKQSNDRRQATAEAEHRSLLHRLPPDLLRHTAEQFCTNGDLMRLARCNRVMLLTLVDFRLSECIGETGLLLAEAAAARMAARRATTAATATDGVRLFSPASNVGSDECSAGLASSAHSSASATAAEKEAAATEAIKPRGAQSEAASRSGEEATSRPTEAHALDSSMPHVAPLSTSDMRVGRPVRMHTALGEAELRPLAACNSLRALHIAFDYDTLGATPFWASTLSAALPPTLQELQIERTIWIRDSVDELRLPPSLTTLHLPFLRRIQPGVPMADSPPRCPFPLSLPSLTHLTLPWRSAWGAQPLPPSLQSLTIESLESAAAHPSIGAAAPAVWPLLHEGLQSVALAFGAGVSLAGISLPSTLTMLDLRATRFNEPIESLRLPSGMLSLRLNHAFDQPIEKLSLPSSLTELHFHEKGEFNQPIERLRLPSALASLRLSYYFNQPCAALRLPESLTELRFEDRFHGSLPPHLPDSIHSLHLGGKWQRKENESEAAEPPLRLPAVITSFALPPFFPLPLRHHLDFAPNTHLTHLHVSARLQAGALSGMEWPASLRSLHLDCRRSPPDALTQVDWPAGLDELRLDIFLHAEPLLNDWTPPPALTHLRLSHFNLEHLSALRWPPRMQRLSFEHCSLREISPSFRWPSPLPASLTALDLSDEYGRVAQAHYIAEADVPPGLLPHGLRQLRLPHGWRGPLTQHKGLPLPPTLTSLEIGPYFCGSLCDLLRDLPPGLQSLALHHPQPLPSLPSNSSQPSTATRRLFCSSPPRPQPQLPESLRHLRLHSPRHLTAEGWSTRLDERPDCSVSFNA